MRNVRFIYVIAMMIVACLYADMAKNPQMLDLSSAYTTGFYDDVAGDQKGGWTDQGKENDIRNVSWEKPENFGRVPFQIIIGDNKPKTCIVLKGAARPYFPEEAMAELDGEIHGKILNVLHAVAWSGSSEIGTITCEYSDGTQENINVSGLTDVGNWWNPSELPNGKIAWYNENNQEGIGLYSSQYAIEDKPLKRLSFKSAGKAVWCIVAATLTDDDINDDAIVGPVYIEEGDDWHFIRMEQDMEPGSILDFSAMMDAPAGKYGPVVIRDGHFEFRDRPGVRVRFYGTNLVDTAQYMPHEWSEKLAERFAAFGFNLVRIHHHDNGLSTRASGDSSEINADNLDKLNYLIHCFKEKGIYVVTDCYVSRTFCEEELTKWGGRNFKHLVFLNNEAMENWKKFVRNWFTSVNPYTGMALKDDPVLIAVNLINEGNISHSYTRDAGTLSQHEARFQEFLKEKGLTDDPSNWGVHHNLFSLYLLDLYDAGFKTMKSFLRDELGMTQPISDQNHHAEQIDNLMRCKYYDYVDNHYYFDHPTLLGKEWCPPASFSNVSALSQDCADIAYMFSSRVVGRPMAITEYDFAKPNFYRAEGAILNSAYSGLQDWDALTQFAYSHGNWRILYNEKQDVGNWFDLSGDVVKLLSHRIGTLMFLRNEVKPAKGLAVLSMAGIGTKNEESGVPGNVRKLGLITKIGTALADKAADLPKADVYIDCGFTQPEGLYECGIPAVDASQLGKTLFDAVAKTGAISDEDYSLEEGIFRSQGGQLELNDKKQTFRMTGAGAEALILPEGMEGASGIMHVDNQIGRAVFAIASIDGKPIAETNRLLIMYLTDTQGAGEKFGDTTYKQQYSWGSWPYKGFLAKKGEARVSLNLPDGTYSLYSCNTKGQRLAEIPLEETSHGYTFQAQVFRPEGTVMIYELVKSEN